MKILNKLGIKEQIKKHSKSNPPMVSGTHTNQPASKGISLSLAGFSFCKTPSQNL
ncbi:hypothetical protein [Eubacterium limosum]|uniref:hypothetical protein n=1 Tax=Eubacterium limosum TaxID=1736 RepID=UPI0022E8B18C|nr:hypothetical protein [Eubacterium limosum]